MIQDILVAVIFLIASGYVIRMIYKNFTAKSGCSSGCGKCAVDFSKIEVQIKNAEKQKAGAI